MHSPCGKAGVNGCTCKGLVCFVFCRFAVAASTLHCKLAEYLVADMGGSRKWLSWLTVLGVDAIFVFGGSCATACGGWACPPLHFPHAHGVLALMQLLAYPTMAKLSDALIKVG